MQLPIQRLSNGRSSIVYISRYSIVIVIIVIGITRYSSLRDWRTRLELQGNLPTSTPSTLPCQQSLSLHTVEDGLISAALTGPSLTSATSIMAWNLPSLTRSTWYMSLTLWTK